VSAGYFETLGIPLVAGRALSDHDTAETTAVGVVDERAARALWPGGDALGKRFRLHAPGTGWVEIVGVVGHVHNDGLDVDARSQVYWPYRQRPQDRVVLVARGSDARTMVPSITHAIHSVDPDQPVYDVRPMRDVLARSLSQRWLSTAMLSAFAAVSLALAGIGLYGVVALGVTRRSREFAIRLALGAERSNIFGLVLGEGARIAVLGAVSGVPLAIVLARALDSLLFGVTARDPAGLALPSLILVGTAILASLLPARRASGVDPGATLKQE
jgi:predicted permease